MEKLLSMKFPPELLVSLPVFVEDGTFADGTDRVTAMLKDPEILLREDNAQGGKLHARRIESTLDGRFVNVTRVQILEALCTWEWAQSQGVKAKGTYKREGA